MADDVLKEKVQKLNFGIELSMRYHQRRRAFHERNHNVIMFLIIILGSAAFSEVFEESFRYFVALTTGLAALDLVWKPSHRSRDHEVLFRRFSVLASDLRTGALSADSYAKWKKERVMIEAEEPPVYVALANDCHNEVNRARDTSVPLVEIGRWYRCTMNLLRHAEMRFEVAKPST